MVVDQEIGGGGIVNLIEAFGSQGLFDIGADGQAECFIIDAGIAFRGFTSAIVIHVVTRYYGLATVILLEFLRFLGRRSGAPGPGGVFGNGYAVVADDVDVFIAAGEEEAGSYDDGEQ